MTDTAGGKFPVNAPTMSISARKVHIVGDGAALCNKRFATRVTGSMGAEQPAGFAWRSDLYALCPRCEAKHAAMHCHHRPCMVGRTIE